MPLTLHFLKEFKFLVCTDRIYMIDMISLIACVVVITLNATIVLDKGEEL